MKKQKTNLETILNHSKIITFSSDQLKKVKGGEGNDDVTTTLANVN